MPKLKVVLALPGDEVIKVGKKYVIASVEEFTSDVNHYKGIRVTLVDDDGQASTSALWLGDVVNRASKLGAFIDSLGDDTDNWSGRIIQFETWTAKARKIRVLPDVPRQPPKEKSREGVKEK